MIDVEGCESNSLVEAWQIKGEERRKIELFRLSLFLFSLLFLACVLEISRTTAK